MALKDFIAQVKTNGLARTNRFAILMTPPVSVNDGTLRKVMLFCEQAQLPGTNFSTVQNRTFGEFRETPYEKLYDPCNLTFYVDTGMQVKTLFDNWTHSIQDPVTRTFNYYNEYTTDLTIIVQDLQDKTRYTMTLYECYPKTVSSVQMDNNSKDIMKLNVTMQYKYWHATSTEVLPSGEIISTNAIDSYRQNFTGFQEKFNKGLSDVQNFVTGGAVQYATSYVSKKLNGLLNF